MKIIIAPDSFKGSMTAQQISETLTMGMKSVFPEADYIQIPVADGGEGTVKTLVNITGGKIIPAKVSGPMGRSVDAYYGILGDQQTAVIEMAVASGITMVKKEERNPLYTTTYGTGELIRHALDQGIRKMMIGLGGSGTNDGGTGMAQALGIQFFDKKDQLIQDKMNGYLMGQVQRINMSSLHPKIKGCEVMVACDVDNLFSGPNGAARIYAPQKGADPEVVRILDDHLNRLAFIIKRDLGISINQLAGAGAAGGLGGGLVAFLNAKLQRGIEIILKHINFENTIRDADLIITGEGKIDETTLRGKTPLGIARMASRCNIPVIAIAGEVALTSDQIYNEGVDLLLSITNGPISETSAMAHAPELVRRCGERVARLIKMGQRLKKQ